jgi:hypothetical protein
MWSAKILRELGMSILDVVQKRFGIFSSNRHIEAKHLLSNLTHKQASQQVCPFLDAISFVYFPKIVFLCQSDETTPLSR